MNNVLQSGYDALPQQERKNLRSRLADSPRAIALLDFLEVRKGRKFNTVDAVNTIYADNEEEDFPVLRNRFFKLRKHVLSMLDQSAQGSTAGISLLPLEEELFRCRQLIGGNHFHQVAKQLKNLIATCKRLNVFELLPEAYNHLIYANLALNNFKDQERLLMELEESSRLLDDFRTIQALSRRVYLGAISRNVAEVSKQLHAMRRIVVKRSAWPRFELYYHFIVVTNAASIPGYSGKGHARHLTRLRQLIARHPDMPAGSYEPNGLSILQYYLKVADGTYHFMKGDVHTCYQLFKEAWDIQERIPNLRVRKSESNFKNKVAIEIATGRFHEAIRTAHALVDFHREHKQEEKRLQGYAELAMIYTYAYPQMKCPDPEFLARQLKTFASVLKKNRSSLYGDILSTQAIFAFMCGDWQLAGKVARLDATRAVFRSMQLEIYFDVLTLSPAASKEKINAVRKNIRAQMQKSESAHMVFSLKRAMKLLDVLES